MNQLTLILGIICLGISAIHAQEKKEERSKSNIGIQIKAKADLKPDIYIDGTKYDHAILDLLDPNKIESMNVIKGDQAKNKYGAPQGVILIVSKKSTAQDSVIIDDGGVQLRGEKEPVIIIDGVVATQEELTALDPDQIESISVYKDEQAMEKYNAPDGAVVIKLKKVKKKKK